MSADISVILFILMRTDMKSMNPGKAMAQASHASNKAVIQAFKDNPDFLRLWENQTSQGFGTVLVLDGKSMDNIEGLVAEAEAVSSLFDEDCVAGIVYDPTYPLVDGQTIHYIPINTCGYILAHKDSRAHKVIQNLKLHA